MIKIVSVRSIAVVAAAAVLALLPRCHMPHTYRGKVMCNGILADEAEFRADGAVTVHAMNGAVVTILDGASCAVLDREPSATTGPEIEE